MLAPRDADGPLAIELVVETGAERHAREKERALERAAREAVHAAADADVRYPAEDVDHVGDADGAVVDRRGAVPRAVREVLLLIGRDDDAARLDGEVPLIREAVRIVESAAAADARRRLAVDREDAERRCEAEMMLALDRVCARRGEDGGRKRQRRDGERRGAVLTRSRAARSRRAAWTWAGSFQVHLGHRKRDREGSSACVFLRPSSRAGPGPSP